MVACSMGEVTVLTGAAGLRVEGVNCCLGALSLECSIESLPLLMSARCGEIGAVTVTMAQSYQSAAGYGRSGTSADQLASESEKPLTAEVAEKFGGSQRFFSAN